MDSSYHQFTRKTIDRDVIAGFSVPSLRSSSVREQLAASASAAVAVAPNPGPGAPRSLFGRLGIRKPSILSLTSPHASGYSPATARTFSLDDLLKPPPRRKAECQNQCVNSSLHIYILHTLSFTTFSLSLSLYTVFLYPSVYINFVFLSICLKLFVMDNIHTLIHV